MKRVFLILLAACSLTGLKVQSQNSAPIILGEIIKAGEYGGCDDEQFVFLEFWATWCAPCIQAMPRVEILQQEFHDKVCFIAVTEEGPIPVEDFLRKHETKTNIALDYNQITHVNFNVSSLPQSVLLAPDGNIIWQGHPADMSNDMMRTLIQQARYKNAVKKIEVVKANLPEPKKERVKDKVSVTPLTSPEENGLMMEEDEVVFTGKLSQLFADLLNVSSLQVRNESAMNKNIQVRMPLAQYLSDKPGLLVQLQKDMNLSLSEEKEKGEVYDFDVFDKSKLWNMLSFTWGDGAPEYMMDDMKLEADNVTVSRFCSLLSEVFQKPVIVSLKDDTKYDWSLHVKFENLMLEQLKEEYGVNMELKKMKYPVFVIK